MLCNNCGVEYRVIERHECAIEGPKDLLSRLSPWMKGAGAIGVGLFAMSTLPATVTTLVASGSLIGGMWILMVLMPLGDPEKDWLARHPRTFMLLHLPTTVGISMLGEGIIMAFGNLLGGVFATLYLMAWGHKRHITAQGKKGKGYVSPEPNKSSLILAQGRFQTLKAIQWLVAPGSACTVS